MTSSSRTPHRTLGIDLASQAAKTGLCLVEWGAGVARVELPAGPGTDEAILELQQGCDAIGIDSPFGWPEAFVKFLDGRPGGGPEEWSDERRDALCFRRTDFVVAEIIDRWPLSVSSNRIAVPAMRCAGLLTRMEVANRSGDGRVFEVYPAAALNRWGLPDQKYKGSSWRKNLAQLVGTLLAQCPWLEVDAATRKALAASDDRFDALVCALVARAAALGLTMVASEDDEELARREGWIHLPLPGSLGGLMR